MTNDLVGHAGANYHSGEAYLTQQDARDAIGASRQRVESVERAIAGQARRRAWLGPGCSAFAQLGPVCGRGSD